MPIEAIYWDRGKRAMEVHVLAGTTSPDLRVAHLRFLKRDANHDPQEPFAKAYLDDPANANDVALTFTIADASVAPGTRGRTFAARGIMLNEATGAVHVDPATSLPALIPPNFLLEVQAVSGPNTFRELIRVHVHRSIQKIWLTPDPLTVRPRRAASLPSTTPSRFALRARFDDESVGDITDWPGIEWRPTSSVTAEGRLIVNAGDAAGPPIEVTARLPAHPAVPTAKARLRVVDAWRPEAPILARLVPGGGWAKPFAIEAVPNVLFLPDGFPDAEAYFKFVNKLVEFAKTNPLCKPYDRLANSINFWAAFVPSARPGITWGSELFLTTQYPAPMAFALDRPQRPQGVGDPWEMKHLIYEIGLPAPRDRMENTTRTNEMVMADLDALFGTAYRTHLPTKPEARKGLFEAWRRMGNRRIVDDLDTPLGAMSGSPRVDNPHDHIKLNPDRMDRERLDDLLSAIRHDQAATSGLQLNTLWTDPRRRNYDLVCLVTVGLGREINSFGYFTLSQQGMLEFGILSGVNDIAIEAPTIREKPHELETRTFIHELSHSFDLGDEYAGKNDRPLFRPHQEWVDRSEGNLQSPFSITRGGAIHGDEIKWRWHRIRWAAEIIDTIKDLGGGVFEAPVRASHAFAFPDGQIVHLRFRDIHHAFRDKAHDNVHFDDQSAYLVKQPLLSVPLRLAKPTSGTPPVFKVKLRVEPGVQFPYPPQRTIPPDRIVASFPPGSIVYCPTRAPAGVFDAVTYPYAELIAKDVKDHITLTGGPVGRSRADLTLPDHLGLPPGFLPADFPSASSPFIVGLYEGGMGNMTGVFHPTGNCMMSNQNSGARFCHVCQYVLVDAIDPSKHYFIDPEYTPIYPQR